MAVALFALVAVGVGVYVAVAFTSVVGVGLGDGFRETTDLYSSATGLNDGQMHVVAFTRQGDAMTLGGMENVPSDDLPPICSRQRSSWTRRW